MANSIRTPRQGKTLTSRRIAQAVDNEEWQEFRVSLKGKSTAEKLTHLKRYWNNNVHGHVIKVSAPVSQYEHCDYCIRVDNYIKALCRGGQLYPGESLLTALAASWNLDIKHN